VRLVGTKDILKHGAAVHAGATREPPAAEIENYNHRRHSRHFSHPVVGHEGPEGPVEQVEHEEHEREQVEEHRVDRRHLKEEDHFAG
jgi:hypothetical protein